MESMAHQTGAKKYYIQFKEYQKKENSAMEKYKNLIPENDLQEAWELVGRREAVMSYIECTQYANTPLKHILSRCPPFIQFLNIPAKHDIDRFHTGVGGWMARNATAAWNVWAGAILQSVQNVAEKRLSTFTTKMGSLSAAMGV